MPRVKKLRPELYGERWIADAMREIGRAWGGTLWQSDLAREIKCSKSLITRTMDMSRAPSEGFWSDVRLAMLNRIVAIAEKLNAKTLPMANTPTTKKAISMIKEAVAMMKAEEEKKNRAAA